MSASDPNSAIYMADTPNQIKNKINRHAFSGGGDTLELHQKNGGNPDVDVAFQYLSFFEEDDEKLAKVAAVSSQVFCLSAGWAFDAGLRPQDYRAGTLMTGQLKALCIKALQDEVKAFQEVRSFSHSALEPI
jgi:tryptophanyl-tRNA synthetase